MSTALFSGVVIVMATAVIIRIARGSAPERELDWFSFQYDVATVEPARSRLLEYLRRTRRWRVAGAAFGVAVSFTAAIAGVPGIGMFTSLFTGWFLAGILGEVRSGGASSGDRRAASLAPRRLRHFMPPAARRSLAIAVLTTAVTLLIALLMHTDAGLRYHRDTAPPWSAIAAWTATAAGVSVTAAVGLHRLLHKPYPVDDPELDAAEYAIRTAAVVRVTAGWTALLWIITNRAATACTACATTDWQPLTVLLSWGAVIGTFVAWAWVPTRVVRRTRHRLGSPA